jgi:5'-nucleotidase
MRHVLAVLLVVGSVNAGSTAPARADEPAPWPRRVLITNDNGLDDPKIVALARAFAAHTETWVVAPRDDRSGSTHFLSVSRTGGLRAVPRNLGPGIRAWAVDGYPADCVLLARYGLMRDALPDLVVSGINGGPNLAHDWLGSGTIGAARMAAYLGVPAIAVSGLDDDIPGAVEAATAWVVALAQSDAIRELSHGQYLTVSMPRIAPSAIAGVRLARRAGLLLDIAFESVAAVNGQQWKLAITPRAAATAPGRDAALYDARYIVIVPMRADEHDEALEKRFTKRASFPAWVGSRTR